MKINVTCPDCGTETALDASRPFGFCSACGKKLTVPAPHNAAAQGWNFQIVRNTGSTSGAKIAYVYIDNEKQNANVVNTSRWRTMLPPGEHTINVKIGFFWCSKKPLNFTVGDEPVFFELYSGLTGIKLHQTDGTPKTENRTAVLI